MSVRALTWAFEQNIDATAKLVLLALADHVSDDGACWVGMRTLKGKTSLKDRAIQAACRRLEAAGMIRCSSRFQGDRQTTNLWEVAFQARSNPTASNAPSPPHEMRGAPAPDAPTPPHQMHPMNRKDEPSFKPNNTPLPPKGGKTRERKVFNAGEFDHLIPEELALSGAFVRQWHAWVEDRRNRRKTITEEAARLQLKKLETEAKTAEVAIAWIRNSIEKGYTGLFPPTSQSRPQPQKPDPWNPGFDTKVYTRPANGLL